MARLGSPENPEIIAPGGRPVTPRYGAFGARLRTAVKLVKSLLLVCAPALLLDYAWIALVDRGWHEHSALSILLALLLSPPALIATGLAVLAGPLLLTSLLFLTLGRPVRFETGRAFARFGAQRR